MSDQPMAGPNHVWRWGRYSLELVKTPVGWRWGAGNNSIGAGGHRTPISAVVALVRAIRDNKKNPLGPCE